MEGTPNLTDGNQIIIDALLHAAEQLLLESYAYSFKGNAARVNICKNKIIKIISYDLFPRDLANDIIYFSERLQRETYEKLIETLVFEGFHAARTGNGDQKKLAQQRLAAAIAEARGCGVSDDFLDSVDARRNIIRLTNDGKLDQATKSSAQIKLHTRQSKPRNKVENRKAIRYIDPTLVIECKKYSVYRTIDWSIRGFLVSGAGPYPPAGRNIKFTVRCGLLPEFVAKMDSMVVRVNKTGEFAISLADISTEILRLLYLLKLEGIRPELT